MRRRKRTPFVCVCARARMRVCMCKCAVTRMCECTRKVVSAVPYASMLARMCTCCVRFGLGASRTSGFARSPVLPLRAAIEPSSSAARPPLSQHVVLSLVREDSRVEWPNACAALNPLELCV